MRARQTLPDLWLLSDERNDAGLEAALRRLPRGSGFVFRHYHLEPAERIARFRTLRRIARAKGHTIMVADSALTAREWEADGIYGAPRTLWPRNRDLRIATAHSLKEIGLANLLGADAIMLSPAFPTRSHPGAKALGPLRFRLLAAHSKVPVIALGGVTQRHADRLHWRRWAAIDGLS